MQESPSHFPAPSPRAMARPTTNRNMATDRSTVMTTMPPVLAIPNSIDSMFLPVRRENLSGLEGSLARAHSLAGQPAGQQLWPSPSNP